VAKSGEDLGKNECVLQIDKPILLTEYAWKNRLQALPHWEWTLDYATSEDEAIAIAQAFKASSRMDKHYKLRIEVPQSIKDALQLDTLNNNKLWQEAIEKEFLCKSMIIRPSRCWRKGRPFQVSTSTDLTTSCSMSNLICVRKPSWLLAVMSLILQSKTSTWEW
jgi:hypothetical protein